MSHERELEQRIQHVTISGLDLERKTWWQDDDHNRVEYSHARHETNSLSKTSFHWRPRVFVAIAMILVSLVVFGFAAAAANGDQPQSSFVLLIDQSRLWVSPRPIERSSRSFQRLECRMSCSKFCICKRIFPVKQTWTSTVSLRNCIAGQSWTCARTMLAAN